MQENAFESGPMACDAVRLVYDAGAAKCSNIAGFFGQLALKTDSGFSPVLPQNEGCNWQISFASGPVQTIPVPSNYTGGSSCKFGPAQVSFFENSSVQYATHKLLQNLDWDNDSLVDLNIDDIYAEFDYLSVDESPYLWGPAIIEVRAWY